MKSPPPKPRPASVMDYLSDQDLMNLRLASKGMHQAVTEHVNQTVPYPSKARFIMGNAKDIPEFQAKRFTVPRESAVKASYEMYNKAARGSSGPAFLERIEDKDPVFGPKGTPRRDQLDSNGQLFATPTYPVVRKDSSVVPKDVWSPQINDAWVMGHVHAQHHFELHSPPTEENLYSSADARPTATGREVLQLRESGYQPTARKPANPINVRPLEFTPSDPATAQRMRIGDTERVPNPRQTATTYASFSDEFAANLRKAFASGKGLF